MKKQKKYRVLYYSTKRTGSLLLASVLMTKRQAKDYLEIFDDAVGVVRQTRHKKIGLNPDSEFDVTTISLNVQQIKKGDKNNESAHGKKGTEKLSEEWYRQG